MASMSSQQLIQYLEARGLLSADLLSELRSSVAKQPDVSPRKLVRWLVKNGHLSRFQGEELLSARPEPAPQPWEAPAQSGPSGSGKSAGQSGQQTPGQQGPGQLDELDVIDDLEEIGPGDLAPLPPLGSAPPALPSLDALMQATSMPPG